MKETSSTKCRQHLKYDVIISKVHLYLDIENAIDLNTCPYAHGFKGLTCQCRFEFGHAGNCECFDKTCNMEWSHQ